MDIWAPRLSEAMVLDLFAGSGAVGIEAVSRGAAGVCLVDRDPEVLRLLAKNALVLEEDEVRVISLTLPGGLSTRSPVVTGTFDLIFADPPYTYGDFTGLLVAVEELLTAAGELVVEHASNQDLPAREGWMLLVDRRRYGDTALSFYRRG